MMLNYRRMISQSHLCRQKNNTCSVYSRRMKRSKESNIQSERDDTDDVDHSSFLCDILLVFPVVFVVLISIRKLSSSPCLC